MVLSVDRLVPEFSRDFPNEENAAMRKLVVLASLAAFLAFGTLPALTPAQAQYRDRRQQAFTYVCKSGHHVKVAKGCKENGGKW
jgi:hypothetical protein